MMENPILFCFVIFVLIVPLAIVMYARSKNAAKRDAAYSEYQTALQRLKKDPTNSDLKQQALSAGRHYANVARQQKGTNLFDEVALMNDINAATASAGQGAVLVAPRNQKSVEERIQELNQLKAKGLVDEAEFNARKSKILEDL